MMASLTPGVLQKLLDNVDNKDVKVVGEHRTALLQVIGIVPSFDDDPWKNRGFYLRVSDSVHSAYVSVLESDVELILSDKIQLGQFIHVTRLDSGSPVPVIHGLKVVPRRRPCIGEPVDLISSEVLTVRKNVEPKKGKKCVGLEKRLVKGNVKGKERKAIELEDAKLRRLSLFDGTVEGMEPRRLSLDSRRKGWDSIGGKNDKAVGNVTPRGTSMGSDMVLARKKPPVEESNLKHVNVSPLRNKNVILSPKSLGKPIVKDLKLSKCDALPDHLKKMEVNFKNWSDSKVSWNSLPTSLCDLGKEIKCQRNKSFVLAVRAMEEASAAEGVIRCMSLFSELSEASDKDSPGAVVESFLSLYDNMQNSAALVDLLLKSRSADAKESYSSRSKLSLADISGNIANKNALTWVQAAIETDLSQFSLLRRDGEKGREKGSNRFLVVIERAGNGKETESSPNKNQRSSNVPQKILNSSKTTRLTPVSRRHLLFAKGANGVAEEWPSESGLKDAANLIEKLLCFSRGWFLNYLESFLEKGSRQKTNELDSETTILGHLKRVNKWLDDTNPSSTDSSERIRVVRRKLYGFLLDHVDSAGSQS